MAHDIEDYFPGGGAPRITLREVDAPPLSAARPEPADIAPVLDPVVQLLRGKRFAVLTGAGLSTDSGLPDYRSPGSRPRHQITLQQFMASEEYRRHYWLRNHGGWLALLRAQPNAGHRALAALEEAGAAVGIITQNVDRLHERAGSHYVVDLHGRFDRVVCTNCGIHYDRAFIHRLLVAANPHADVNPARGQVAPDADLDIAADARFRVVDCPACGGILRTDVVFFGGSVKPEDRASARHMIDVADALLVAGSSLAIGGTYRLARSAYKAGKPLVIINLGPTRADNIAQVVANVSTSRALPYLAAHLSATPSVLRSRAHHRPTLAERTERHLE